MALPERWSSDRIGSGMAQGGTGGGKGERKGSDECSSRCRRDMQGVGRWSAKRITLRGLVGESSMKKAGKGGKKKREREDAEHSDQRRRRAASTGLEYEATVSIAQRTGGSDEAGGGVKTRKGSG